MEFNRFRCICILLFNEKIVARWHHEVRHGQGRSDSQSRKSYGINKAKVIDHCTPRYCNCIRSGFRLCLGVPTTAPPPLDLSPSYKRRTQLSIVLLRLMAPQQPRIATRRMKSPAVSSSAEDASSASSVEPRRSTTK